MELVQSYVDSVLREANACHVSEADQAQPVPDFIAAMQALHEIVKPFIAHLDKALTETAAHVDIYNEWLTAIQQVTDGWATFSQATAEAQIHWHQYRYNTTQDLLRFVETDRIIAGLAEQSRDLLKEIDLSYKLATRLIDHCEQEHHAKDSALWDNATINGTRKNSLKKAADNARKLAVEQLKQVRYFYKQAHWLVSRFPDGKLVDVEGLVKLVEVKEIAAADWSLTPGRYVGVAPEEVDEDFDFEESLRDIHIELKGLNEEAAELAAQIARNFEELGV